MFQHAVEAGRRQHRRLPLLPADGRRDGRQGLRRRAPARRPRRAADGARARRVRVPGAEVLGRLPRVRPPQPLVAPARRPRGDHRVADDGRRHRPVELHGCGHRRPRVRQAPGGARAGEGRRHRHGGRRRHLRRQRGLVRAADGAGVERPRQRDLHDRVLRADPGRARLRRRRLRRDAGADGVGRAVRADRRDHRPGPGGRRATRSSSCGSRPATSTSTTSRPAPSSGSSPSAAPGRAARTTRPVPRRTCCAGPAPARSRRRSSRRPTSATRTWAEASGTGSRGRWSAASLPG